MSAVSLLEYLSQIIFCIIFLVVARDALRQPTQVKLNAALFFGAFALIITLSWLLTAFHIDSTRWLSAFARSVLLALPYLLLRLLDGLAVVPALIKRLVEIGLAALIVLVFTVNPLPSPVVLLLAIFFLSVIFYDAWIITRGARRAGGVTRRRMQAIAVGSVLLGFAILYLGLSAVFDNVADFSAIIVQSLVLAAGLAYYLGFATPSFLRKAWQEPELRYFLGRAARLPRLGSTAEIVQELEYGAATSVGAPGATIGLWDPEQDALTFPAQKESTFLARPSEYIAGRVFQSQRAMFIQDATRFDPEHAEIYRRSNVIAVLAAPINAGTTPLGVLTVFAPRAPIFAEDDLNLVKLLADQAAVVLESRALIDEAARVHAREEAARLKDDFLSAAAHDLKTPLTALVMRAQLLERQAARRPEAPIDVNGVRDIVEQADRLRSFVLDLLDAARVEGGQIPVRQEQLDLVGIASDVCRRYDSPRHPCRSEHNGPVVVLGDKMRLEQLLDNLVENAVKYSPDGGTVTIRVWRDDELAHVSVSDQGIGIPAEDLPYIFDRFHRSANATENQYLGLGLGLYICRGIVEQHGGEIEATSEPNAGTTFHVTLPAAVSLTAPV